jgi:hypothetical protein
LCLYGYSLCSLSLLLTNEHCCLEVAKIDSDSGTLMLEMTSTTCESKAGGVGTEEIQCWDAANDENPVIMSFTGVKQLSVPSSVTRRLSGANYDSKSRRLQTTDFVFSCVQSETSLGDAQSARIDYEKCQIPSGVITIEETLVDGYGITTFTGGSALTGEITMPSPIQDVLNTIVRHCDSRWTLTGHTNLEILGDEIKQGCHITASGSVEATAILTVDLGAVDCTSTNGLSIELNEGSLSIDGNEILSFGAPFADIYLVTSPCGDSGTLKAAMCIVPSQLFTPHHNFFSVSLVNITKTYADSSSIEITVFDGDSSIVIGNEAAAFDTQIFSSIIIDAGDGFDSLKIYDTASNVAKSVEIRPTTMKGLHADTVQGVSYFGIESVDIELGTAAANLTVHSTAKNTTMKVSSQSGDDVINIFRVKGPLEINSGDGNDFVNVTKVDGTLDIDTGEKQAIIDLLFIFILRRF